MYFLSVFPSNAFFLCLSAFQHFASLLPPVGCRCAFFLVPPTLELRLHMFLLLPAGLGGGVWGGLWV